MSQQNVNTAAAESKETSIQHDKGSSISYDAIRRALRRPLFDSDRAAFNVNTILLRTLLDMQINYLVAATFTRDEAGFGPLSYRTTTELLFIRPQEKLLITVMLYGRKAGARPENYQTRVVHSANMIGNEACEESAEYETTNVYKASGKMTDEALEVFWSEHENLKNHASENLPKADAYSPFCHWQYSSLRG